MITPVNSNGPRVTVSPRNRAQTLVLLSAHNGARFIAEQIESIRAQNHTDWLLLIRDDASSDDTAEIVRQFASRDVRVELFTDGRGNVGPWASFGILLSEAASRGARYAFFCDQDDVWKPDKMSAQLELLRSLETEFGPDRPVLVHSDLEIVDENLEHVHLSFHEFQRMSYDPADPLGVLMLHNAIVGCTMAFNRALMDLAQPLPEGSAHDWWLALCAAATGEIRSTGTTTVRYRQHASNTIGARPRYEFIGQVATQPRRFVSRALEAFKVGVDHAEELSKRVRKSFPSLVHQADRLEQYSAAFRSDSFLKRARFLRFSGARPRRRVSRAILYAILATYPTIMGGRVSPNVNRRRD